VDKNLTEIGRKHLDALLGEDDRTARAAPADVIIDVVECGVLRGKCRAERRVADIRDECGSKRRRRYRSTGEGEKSIGNGVDVREQGRNTSSREVLRSRSGVSHCEQVESPEVPPRGEMQSRALKRCLEIGGDFRARRVEVAPARGDAR